jgi:hypothetical protein
LGVKQNVEAIRPQIALQSWLRPAFTPVVGKWDKL